MINGLLGFSVCYLFSLYNEFSEIKIIEKYYYWLFWQLLMLNNALIRHKMAFFASKKTSLTQS